MDLHPLFRTIFDLNFGRRTMKSCGCQVGPGKFEGESALAYLAYLSALHGDADTSTYHGDTVVDWFRSPFNFDAEREAVFSCQAYGFCEPCVKQALEDESFGLSLRQDNNGFVYLTRYATEKEYDEALAVAEDEESELCDC